MNYYFKETEFEYYLILRNLQKDFNNVYNDFDKIADFMRPSLEEVLILLRIESVKNEPNLDNIIEMIKVMKE